MFLYFSAFREYPYDIYDLNDKDYDKMEENIKKMNLNLLKDLNILINKN